MKTSMHAQKNSVEKLIWYYVNLNSSITMNCTYT